MVVLPELDRDAVRSGFDSLLGLPGGADDHVRFRRGVFESQLKALDDVSAAPEAPRAGRLRAALSALRDRSRDEGRPFDHLERLLADAGDDPSGLVLWVEAARTEPRGTALAGVARRVGVAIEVLGFYGAVLSAPSLHASVRSRPAPGGATPRAGSCPCCGSAPGLALITPPDGRRVLCCGTCAARWDEARLACPGCGDTSALVTLRDPARVRTWLEACDTCRGAVTTVDLRLGATWGASVLPLVERTAALPLDLLVEGEGYTPLHPYAALL